MGDPFFLDPWTRPFACGAPLHTSNKSPTSFSQKTCQFVSAARSRWLDQRLRAQVTILGPPDCRTGPHSSALLTTPPTSSIRSVSLNFEDFTFGTSWTQNFKGAQP